MNSKEIHSLLTDDLQKEMTSCCLKTQSQAISDHKELIACIQNFKPEQGWLALQGKVIFFYAENKLYEQLPEDMLIINGEMCNSQSESLHIIDQQEQWLCIRYTEQTEQTAEQQPDSLFDKQNMLGNKRAEASEHPKILYHRYWKHTEHQGIHPYAARFTGFENPEDLA